MFTGLIQQVGSVAGLSGQEIRLKARFKKVQLGESIAVNGVCLTVTKKTPSELRFDLSAETLKKTNLSLLKQDSPVNLERCVTLQTLLGGHLVQGHVDGIGRVDSIRKSGAYKEIGFKSPASVMRYVVEKGSVTVNGVSLTAIGVKKDTFFVALVPHTLRQTNLGNLHVGDTVNLEADVLAKYVEKLSKRK